MPQSLISVIIPVYNAEKTIERCVKSIVSHQASVEIICVDDGSADNSFQILMIYQKRMHVLLLYIRQIQVLGKQEIQA